MTRSFKIAECKLTECDRDAGQILVAIAPIEQEKVALQEQFLVDDFDLSSVLDPDEVTRLESSAERMLLIWKVPENASISQAVHLNVSTVGLLLCRERLALVRRSGDVSFTDRDFRKVGDIREVLLAYLLNTIRHFVSHLKIIKQISGELEKKITVSMENKHLLQMFSLGESLIYYVDAIEANKGVLAKVRSIGDKLGLQPHHLLMLDDVILENAQAAQQARIYSTVLSGLMDARGTIVNNNMNVLLKNLTLINIVFLPLNLIASIFGMSEWGMMTKGMNWELSYSLFFVGMIAIGWITWILVKRIIDRGSTQLTLPPRNDGKKSTDAS
jgi:magnesium transporter